MPASNRSNPDTPGSVADGVGSLLDDGDFTAIQNERMRWLLADPVTG